MDEELHKALTGRLTIDVALAGRVFGLGREAAYAAVKRGDIPSLRIGRRLVVPTGPLRRMLGMDPRPAHCDTEAA